MYRITLALGCFGLSVPVGCICSALGSSHAPLAAGLTAGSLYLILYTFYLKNKNN
jgi:hypothetical protein